MKKILSAGKKLIKVVVDNMNIVMQGLYLHLCNRPNLINFTMKEYPYGFNTQAIQSY
jgi:hypothetical protein